jgi:alpha-galactosidase
MAIDRGTDTVVIFGDDPLVIPSFRAQRFGDVLRVYANGGFVVRVRSQPAQVVLGEWAGDVAQALHVAPLRPVPTGWCSWYCYERSVTEDLVMAQVVAAEDLGLPIDVFLLDAGYEVALGDWLTEREGFGSLQRLAAGIRSKGRVPAIWVAPFIAAASSRVVLAHPDWWVTGTTAGHVWGADLAVLDVANDAAVKHVAGVFSELVAMGFGGFKLDFLYAGVLGGGGANVVSEREDVEGYRHFLVAVRDAIGPDPLLLGCGAPLIPSIGLFDSMRVSCDVGANWYEPGQLDQGPTSEVWYPSGRAALRSGAARVFAHGRWWVNDPDCIMARPQMENRGPWCDYLERLGGVAFSGDGLADLDDTGLSLTRTLLHSGSAAPLVADVMVGIDEMGRRLPELLG